MTAWQPDVCVYHGHCDDGFASAWAVWKRWGDAVEYVPVHYGRPLDCDVAGKHVLMVDFSLKREAMLEAAKVAAAIVVLDHHKTAQHELTQWMVGQRPATLLADLAAIFADMAKCVDHIEPIIAAFDMGKSGCRLAWEFCHPDKPMPRLLEHIEDRDLWRYKLHGTKQVSAALRSHDHSFQLFEKLATPDGHDALLDDGLAILRAHDKNVSEFLEQAYMADVAGHHTVPVVNVPYRYASDCAHALLKRHPDAPFAATWWRLKEGKVGWSLRSEDSRVDVSEVAAKLGGGGHRNAAGFSLPALEVALWKAHEAAVAGERLRAEASAEP